MFLCLGAGIIYNGTLSLTLSFFPDITERISGILLMGFGCGASVIGTLVAGLIVRYGFRNALCLLGGMLVGIQTAGSLMLTGELQPETETQGAQVSTRPCVSCLEYSEADIRDMIGSVTFWFYFLWAVLLSSAALIVVGNSAAIASRMAAFFSTMRRPLHKLLL